MMLPTTPHPPLHLQVKKRFPDAFVSVTHPLMDEAQLMSGSPIEFAASPIDFARPAPTLGQHNAAILRQLGLSAEEVRALHVALIHSPPSHPLSPLLSPSSPSSATPLSPPRSIEEVGALLKEGVIGPTSLGGGGAGKE
jgi:hypothetical protein